MTRPRIVEVDYYQFRDALNSAADSGERIEVADKARWKAWVREHAVKEAAFKSIGTGMCDGLEPVIIATDGDWQGYYLVSTDEEVCLKWSKDA